MIAASALVVVLAGLAMFQIALACGAPVGRFAYGGRNAGTLPVTLRVASAVTVLIYAAMAIVTLDRAAIIDVLPATVSKVGMWVLVAFFALGAIPNAVSRSRHERYTMTPATLLLAVLALITALTPDDQLN